MENNPSTRTRSAPVKSLNLGNPRAIYMLRHGPQKPSQHPSPLSILLVATLLTLLFAPLPSAASSNLTPPETPLAPRAEAARPSPTGSPITPGTACQGQEGLWNCIGASFQHCASGQWSVVQDVAAGTRCYPLGESADMHIECAPDGPCSSGGGQPVPPTPSRSGGERGKNKKSSKSLRDAAADMKRLQTIIEGRNGGGRGAKKDVKKRLKNIIKESERGRGGRGMGKAADNIRRGEQPSSEMKPGDVIDMMRRIGLSYWVGFLCGLMELVWLLGF